VSTWWERNPKGNTSGLGAVMKRKKMQKEESEVWSSRGPRRTSKRDAERSDKKEEGEGDTFHLSRTNTANFTLRRGIREA